MSCTKIQSASEFYSATDIWQSASIESASYSHSAVSVMFPINCIWINAHCSSPIICYYHSPHPHPRHSKYNNILSTPNARYVAFHFCSSATIWCASHTVSRVKIFTCQLKCVRIEMGYGTQRASNPFTPKFNSKTHYSITIRTQFCGGARICMCRALHEQ